MKVKNIIIGEDIRHEVGNKVSMMGILGSSINIEIRPDAPKNIPIKIAFAFLISIENSNTANDPKDFDLNASMFLGKNKLLNMNANIQCAGNDRVYHVPIPRLEMEVIETTDFLVHVQILKNGTLVSEEKAWLSINITRNH